MPGRPQLLLRTPLLYIEAPGYLNIYSASIIAQLFLYEVLRVESHQDVHLHFISGSYNHLLLFPGCRIS